MIESRENLIFNFQNWRFWKNHHFRANLWKLEIVSPDIQSTSWHLEVLTLKPYYDNLHARKYMIIHIIYRIFVIWPTNTIFRHNTNIQTKGKNVVKNKINIPIKGCFNIKLSSKCGWNNRRWVAKRFSMIKLSIW